MQKHYGYLHSTGAYGSFGTAAGIGKIMNLSLQQLNNALSIADFHAPMTPGNEGGGISIHEQGWCSFWLP